MKLTVLSITMVDLSNREAKRIIFSPGKNFISSERNHQGKSVIMKSIYYSLGAEVFYSSTIKKINFLSYIDFEINGTDYRVARLKNSFVIFEKGIFSGLFSSVKAFEEAISKIYNFEINLLGKDENRTIEKCPPAIYYMPYYIDQENGWSASSTSFDRMTQFDLSQRKNSYFFHFGVLDNTYVAISKKKKSNELQIRSLEGEISKYETVVEELKAGMKDSQMSFDSESLERAITTRKIEIQEILKALAKARDNLIRAEDQLLAIKHDKDVLSKYIKMKSPKKEEVEIDSIECPHCGKIFDKSLTQRLEKAYLLESIHDDYSSLTDEQVKQEKRITKYKALFTEQQRRLESYERSLTSNQKVYNAYVKSKATRQLIDEYYRRIGDNTTEIEELRKDNLHIQKQVTTYHEQKNAASIQYQNNLNKNLLALDVPLEQLEDYLEPGAALIASGAYGPRGKISQTLAFVKTQSDLAPDIISFPLVIDSPNVLEQDDTHLDSIIRTLLTWSETDNQIIVASIHGRDIAAEIEDVKIITLTNPDDHLLITEEYALYESEIAEIFTRF